MSGVGHESMTAEGLTYRRLDYWTRKGWLKARNAGCGTGRAREWSAHERLIATIMARLIAAGFTPEAAHRAARRMRNGTCEIAPGIRVAIEETQP